MNDQTKSDTPETDAIHEVRTDREVLSQYYHVLDHARKLERERDEARRLAEKYAEVFEHRFDLPWEK